jgi:N-acetylglucosamine-6-sulfatase
MPYRSFALTLLALILGAAPIGSRAQVIPQSKQRPNIIFIFTDDHAPQSISAYGSKINQTPNLDRLAEEGAIFLNSFCGNSICGPSRATILTGLHSHANGFKDNTSRFDNTQQTFAKLLQKAGYTTAIIGKYHLWGDPVGFDHWMVLPGQGSYYNPDFLTPDGRKRIEGHATNVVTDLALDWLKEGRDQNKPFVLMCQHKAPHRSWMPALEDLDLYKGKDLPEPDTLFDDYEGRGPAAPNQQMEIDRHMFFAYDLQVPVDEDEALFNAYERNLARMTPEQRKVWDEKYEQENAEFIANKDDMTDKEIVRWKYQRYVKNYLRCIAGVDRGVGRILKYLDDNPELKENTIVIYSSDQGFYLGEHGWYDKRWMYEESLAMPLLARWPGVIEPGTRVEALVQNIDYAPTFLDVAGVKPEKPMHGRSLIDLMRDDAKPWRDAVYYRYYESRGPHRVAAHYGVRTDRYTLIYFNELDYWELYDLEKDPQQLKSVYDDPAYADVVKRLKNKLKELRKQYGEKD